MGAAWILKGKIRKKLIRIRPEDLLYLKSDESMWWELYGSRLIKPKLRVRMGGLCEKRRSSNDN